MGSKGQALSSSWAASPGALVGRWNGSIAARSQASIHMVDGIPGCRSTTPTPASFISEIYISEIVISVSNHGADTWSYTRVLRGRV